MPKDNKAKQKREERREQQKTRYGRVTKTPVEAARERLRQREQEQAEQERRLEERQRIAEERQQAILNLPPTTNRNRSKLDDIAFNIHNAYDWDGHGDECVTCVVKQNDNTYRVFPQRFMVVMETYAGKHYAGKDMKFMPGACASVPHLHAEMYAVYYYLALGQNPADHIKAMGVSKRICPDCAAVLDAYGIVYNVGWTTGDASSHWKDPWDILTEDCKGNKNIYNWKRKPDDEDDEDGGGGNNLNYNLVEAY
jgi:hypothetical protein